MTGVGLSLPQLGPGVDGPLVREFCEAAEAAGYTSLWVQEHIFYPVHPSSDYAGIPGATPPVVYQSALGATELLAAAACYTTRCTIGTSVLVGGYHRPVELAQRLATIDILSQGRLVAGLGVGWSDDEHRQMDVDPRTRGRRLGELVEALRAMWAPDPVQFSGEFFEVPPAYVSPKPVQARVPLVSGAWSKPGLRRTATHFDGWNPAGLPAAWVRRVADELRELRPPELPPLSIWFRVFPQPPTGTADLDQMFREVEAAHEAGFDEVIIDAHFWDEISTPDGWLGLIDRMRPALG